MLSSGDQKTFDVAVIGAGVFGSWTAYHLRRTGKRILLIDAYGAGHSRSSSGGESRIIRMGYGTDEIYSRSAKRALELWREFFARTGEEDLFQQTGVLWLAHADDPHAKRSAETLEKLGISFQRLNLSDLHERFPQFDLDRISWAMFEPESGIILARRAVHAVAREAIKNGVVYLQHSAQLPRADKEFSQITTTEGQRISAAVYVFACGPWLPKLFPDLLADRIHPTRQEVFFFGAPAGDNRFSAPAMPSWIDFANEAYGVPDIEGRGVKVAIDRHGPAFDPDRGERLVSAEGLSEVRRYLARRLPAMRDAPVIEARVCQYENTSHGDFLIDRHPELDNVWLVGGGSGHGFKHGPAVGEYVAARIDGRSDRIEPRFSLATKAREHQRSVY